MSEPSIFTLIAKRQIPASIVAETDRVIAFKDIAPKAPVHLLVVPKTEAYTNVVELAAAEPELLAEVIAVAKDLAEEYCKGEFRLVFNTGTGAGQTVFHVHAHLLGGWLSEDSLA